MDAIVLPEEADDAEPRCGRLIVMPERGRAGDPSVRGIDFLPGLNLDVESAERLACSFGPIHGRVRFTGWSNTALQPKPGVDRQEAHDGRNLKRDATGEADRFGDELRGNGNAIRVPINWTPIRAEHELRDGLSMAVDIEGLYRHQAAPSFGVPK